MIGRHELGHTVGLGHRPDSANSCMDSGSEDTNFDSHDGEQISAQSSSGCARAAGPTWGVMVAYWWPAVPEGVDDGPGSWDFLSNPVMFFLVGVVFVATLVALLLIAWLRNRRRQH